MRGFNEEPCKFRLETFLLADGIVYCPMCDITMTAVSWLSVGRPPFRLVGYSRRYYSSGPAPL